MARTSRRSIVARQREHRALELRSRGYTFHQIATELDFASRSSAYEAVERALNRAPAQAASELRRVAVAQLDQIERTAWDILERHHYVVVMHGPKAGELVRHPETDEPLQDSGPALQALAVLLKTNAERRKLYGLDAPAKRSANT
ncbi:MAG: hypothetical protein ACRDVP_11040 [Acidimicrobiales bacterium]